MKNRFITLSNTQAFLAGFEIVEQRGASENCFMVVEGAPGYGKTSTAQWFAAHNNLPFLRAKREWKPAWMMRELLDKMQAGPERSHEARFRQIIEELGKRAAIANAEGRPFAVIVDEADHVVGSSGLIETLRDISDLIEVPIILIGMKRIKQRLSLFPQVASRIEGGAHIEFTPLTFEDTKALINGRCECEVDPDLAALVHEKSEGFAREVLSGLTSIERVGRRLGRAVKISDMEGHVLMTPRSTGHQFMVRL